MYGLLTRVPSIFRRSMSGGARRLPDCVLQLISFSTTPILNSDNGNYEWRDRSTNGKNVIAVNYNGGSVDWNVVRVKQYEDADILALDNAIPTNFWSNGATMIEKQLSDFTANHENAIFADVRDAGELGNVATVKATCIPLDDDTICSIKCSTGTGQIYTSVAADTLICACDIIQ